MTQTRGEAFRKTIAAEFDLDTADSVWLAMLDEVCRSMDLVERMEANVADESMTVKGSNGQPRANPLLTELRQQRASLARLLNQLDTDEAETQSQRQARIARKRWQ